MRFPAPRIPKNTVIVLSTIGLFLIISVAIWSDGPLAAMRGTRFTPLIADSIQTFETALAIAFGAFVLQRLHPSWVKRIVLALVVLSMAYLAFEKLGRPLIGVDDANIFFVYARNLRQGHGFVYNVGGERVEGVSSLLWVGLLTLAYFVSANPEPLVLLFNVGLLLTTTLLVADFLARSSDDPGEQALITAAYVAFVCVSPEYIAWMTAPLMETGLWSLLLVLATLMLLRIGSPTDTRKIWLFCLVLALLLLTRPEAMLWVCLFVFGLFARVGLVAGVRNAARVVVAPLAFLGATIAGLTLFRLAYFGYPLPNTFYAKVSPSLKYNFSTSFYEYFLKFVELRFLVELAVLAVAVFLTIGVIRIIRSRFRLPPGKETGGVLLSLTLSMICAAGLVIPLLSGGDHFAAFRQYQPIFPLLLLAGLIPFTALVRWVRAQVRSLTLVALLVIGIPVVAFCLTDSVNWQNADLDHMLIAGGFRVAVGGRQTGRSLQELFEGYDRLPSVGVTAAGGIKYTYPGEVIDLLGLNNTRIAHSPGLREGMKNHAAFNNDLFFELAPEVALTTCNPDDPDYWFHYIQLDRRFLQQYDCVDLQKSGTSIRMTLAVRRDFLASLQKRGQEAGIILSAPKE